MEKGIYDGKSFIDSISNKIKLNKVNNLKLEMKNETRKLGLKNSRK
jgi:hypothetical protein